MMMKSEKQRTVFLGVFAVILAAIAIVTLSVTLTSSKRSTVQEANTNDDLAEEIINEELSFTSEDEFDPNDNIGVGPSSAPSDVLMPSFLPTKTDTKIPSMAPSTSRVPEPSWVPSSSIHPTFVPTVFPITMDPSPIPTTAPSSISTSDPTPLLTTNGPTKLPTTESPMEVDHTSTSEPTYEPTKSPTTEPTKEEADESFTTIDSTTKFYAIGDVPYTSREAEELEEQMRALPDDAEFLIHVGDIRSARDGNRCSIEEYETVASIMLQSHAPVFLVMGGKCHHVVCKFCCCRMRHRLCKIAEKPSFRTSLSASPLAFFI